MPRYSVGIYREYDCPDLLRQTPDGRGEWEDITFHVGQVDEPCDVLVILNAATREIEVECAEIWQVIQEPPISMFPWVFEGHNEYDRVYSPYEPRLCEDRYNQSHGALPWHLGKTYDELMTTQTPAKDRCLSWVTSNKNIFPGHIKRMQFLEQLQKSGITFDLFGRGFQPLDDKSQGLEPYRYSLALENHSGPHYWTEKLADCFLTWTMPIYYGCTNLADYFPKESFVQIDITDPGVFNQIRSIVDSDVYAHNREAIAEARRLVLDRYQLFPFVASQMPPQIGERRKRIIKPYKESLKSRMKRKWRGLYG